jgi:hypothetical protein
MLDMPAPPVDAGSEEYDAVRARFFFVVARTRLDLFLSAQPPPGRGRSRRVR